MTILLAWFIFGALVSSLELLETVYTVQTITQSSLVYKGLVITSTFDQPLYVQFPCPSSFSVELDSCLGCVNNLTFLEHNVAQNTRSFVQLKNWDTCSGIFLIRFEVVHGTFLPINITWGSASEILSLNSTTVTFFQNCCQDLRRKTDGNWNGLVTIAITSTTPASLVIEIPTDTDHLPIEKYFPLVPVTLVCGTNISCTSVCKENGPATSDPFVSYFQNKLLARLGTLNFSPELLPTYSNKISTIFWIVGDASIPVFPSLCLSLSGCCSN
eukprot:TRINITY_DN6571_c0_g2_i11.p1 TRINITY_DN6571_c0_g2~~TRINITY_DN6571_c0_g2_i11.p1  ORF type:complete len:271 (+),score=26.78 TRINITY_DN6571_c0_g2_i11:87-899(+)